MKPYCCKLLPTVAGSKGIVVPNFLRKNGQVLISVNKKPNFGQIVRK